MKSSINLVWLRSELEAGRRVVEIAADIELTPRTIRNTAHRYGIALPSGRLRAKRAQLLADIGWLRRQRDAGVSVRDLAARLGIRQADLRQILEHNGLRGTDRTTRIDWQQARDLLKTGLPQREVARRLGCSPASIRKIARHAGIPTRHAALRPAELDDSVWLRQQRVDNRRSLVEIAAELGCSTVTVRSALARQGIAPRGRAGVIAVNHGRANELLGDGIAPREIARIVGYSLSTVYRIAAQSGNPTASHKPRPAELDDRDWLVERYVERNESVSVIARDLAVQDATVRAAVNRLRITRRRYPLRRPTPSRLRRDLDRYGNINAVARAHSVSWDTVENWYAQIGIFQHKRPSIPKRDLRQALRNRATTSAAARTLGVSMNRVRVERFRHDL